MKWQQFLNGQCWYSISIDTWKTGDPNFRGTVIWNFSIQSILMKWQPVLSSENWRPKLWGGGGSNLNFFCTIDINEMTAILKWPMLVFHFCWHLENWRPKLWGGLVIWNFSVQLILTKWQPFFNFFIMADADILFLLTLGKPETKLWGGP